MKIKSTLLLLLIVLIAGCSTENDEIIQESITADRLADLGNDPVLCTQTDLIAGQNQTIGTVSVYTDGTTVTVCYDVIAGWTIDATHLYIGDCADRPSNNPGNPMIGQFPYSTEHPEATTFCYEIDQSTLPSGVICVAAHAEAEGTSSETAWGCCIPYGGASWAMYFEVNLGACLPS
jgi:hypothetical protein